MRFGFWLSVFIMAPVLSLRADSGRTASPMDENVLFRWVVAEDRYERVASAQVQPKNLYLRWDNKDQHYVWVTGDNRHQILNKSKVQGARIGFSGGNTRNWFEYNELDSPSWKRNTERKRPEVWRWDPLRVVGGSWTTGTYVSERASPAWESWGGELDPITPPVVEPPVKPPVVDPPVPPPVKPPVVDPPVIPPTTKELGCKITVSAGSAAIGSTVILTMTTTGPVKSAMLNGAAVDFPMVLRPWVVDKFEGTPRPDTITIYGSVKGAKGASAECQVVLKITAK